MNRLYSTSLMVCVNLGEASKPFIPHVGVTNATANRGEHRAKNIDLYLLPILILRFKAFQAFSLRCYQKPVAPNIFIVFNQAARPADFNIFSRNGLA